MKMKLLMGAMLIAAPAELWAQQEAEAPETTRMTLDRMVISAGAEKVAIDTPQAVSTLDQEDIDQTQAMTALRALMSSFDPKHEIKDATCAWALSEWCDAD